MAGDANYPNVRLRLHGDGANNSTVFTDSSMSPKSMTAVGGTKISTAQSRFGGSSILFGASGSAVTSPSSSAWDFGTSDFTIELFVYLSTSPTQYRGVVVRDAIGGTRGWLLTLNDGSGSTVLRSPGFSAFSGATVASVTTTTAIPLNTQTHIAVTREAGVFRLWVAGALAATDSAHTGLSIASSGTPLCIGSLYAASGLVGNTSLDGYVDELEISPFARYTSAFTPPTAPRPDYAGQVAGVVRDAAGANAARTVRIMRRDSGVLVGSTVSDAGTGAYSINCPTLDEVVRIVHSNTTAAPLENDLIDRVIPA